MSDELNAAIGQERSEKVLRGNGKVTEYSRSVGSGEQKRLRIAEKTHAKRGTLDGSGVVETEQFDTVQVLPQEKAWFVLQALADFYNMELRER